MCMIPTSCMVCHRKHYSCYPQLSPCMKVLFDHGCSTGLTLWQSKSFSPPPLANYLLVLTNILLESGVGRNLQHNNSQKAYRSFWRFLVYTLKWDGL